MENNVVKKTRLEWLDALRGFTMILVVAYHVAIMGFLALLSLDNCQEAFFLYSFPYAIPHAALLLRQWLPCL